MAMSGTTHVGRRFMALYVWLPVAVHPAPRRALQISYGLGTTSRALVETRELERIDIVDTSAAVLRLSALAQESPSANPLVDPRVNVHVEDGRFFLLTTPLQYDIITADPPPPKAAGISSLYSLEYFALARSRLAAGGFMTYWLPVYQMDAAEMRAIIGGFCAAFEDCSLWTGFGHEWILLGTRGARGPVSGERFARLRAELGDGFEGIEIDSSRGNRHGIGPTAHSVVTRDLVDQEGHPTRAALDRVLGFFRERLSPG